MHELSLCEGVIRILEETAHRQHFERVKTVRLEIGAFAGVELDAMRFGFEVVKKGTLADGARLEIIELPGRARCLCCGESVEIAQRFDPCPKCGGCRLQITGGEELRVKELEVE